MSAATESSPRVAVIGGGPAGLMAAELLSQAGQSVDLYDAMPSLGRKFLMAGKGGLNLTHAEPFEAFLGRYAERAAVLAPMLRDFGPAQLREWAAALGVETFVGSSGRVFPKEMKAAPLLRRWLHRLREAGVRVHVRHRWLGWAGPERLRFATPQGERELRADALVLALGGGSWPQLGSDAAWVPLLRTRGVPVAALQPANCGFDVGWSAHFRDHHAGSPVKPVIAAFTDPDGRPHRQQGELVITETGIEGGLVYALSAALREGIARAGSVRLELDLLPGRTQGQILAELSRPRGRRSLAEHLRRRLRLQGVKAALLRELADPQTRADPQRLAAAIKALPLRLLAPRPLNEAISSAGGVCFEALDANLMLRHMPGVFCAGEMLDWEAPTGGYLLTACFASGRVAGLGALAWLRRRNG